MTKTCACFITGKCGVINFGCIVKLLQLLKTCFDKNRSKKVVKKKFSLHATDTEVKTVDR